MITFYLKYVYDEKAYGIYFNSKMGFGLLQNDLVQFMA